MQNFELQTKWLFSEIYWWNFNRSSQTTEAVQLNILLMSRSLETMMNCGFSFYFNVFFFVFLFKSLRKRWEFNKFSILFLFFGTHLVTLHLTTFLNHAIKFKFLSSALTTRNIHAYIIFDFCFQNKRNIWNSSIPSKKKKKIKWTSRKSWHFCRYIGIFMHTHIYDWTHFRGG